MKGVFSPSVCTAEIAQCSRLLEIKCLEFIIDYIYPAVPTYRVLKGREI